MGNHINMFLEKAVQLKTRYMNLGEAFEATFELCLSKNPFQDFDSLVSTNAINCFITIKIANTFS